MLKLARMKTVLAWQPVWCEWKHPFLSVEEDSPRFHFILFSVLFTEFRSRTNKMPVLIQIPPSHAAHTHILERLERERHRQREREREQTGRCQKALKMRAACKLFLWQYSFLLGQHSTRTEIERQRQRKKTVGERVSGYGRADWRGPY